MGEKFYAAPMKSTDGSRDDFAACVVRLSDHRRVEAEAFKRSVIENLTKPVAIFRTSYDGTTKKHRFCTICEEADLAKNMAKYVAKFAKSKNQIVVNSNLPHIEKQIRKRAKKRGKKLSISTFNRSTPDATTIYIVD